MNALECVAPLSDEPGASSPVKVNQAWLVTFCDLIALMLTFFVMLYTISARDPSKVDAAVGSVKDKFAKSRVFSDHGAVAAQSGIVLTDQEYLDAVVTTIRGRSDLGEIKALRASNGTLMTRLARDKVFIPKTGVLSQAGRQLAHDIAQVMQNRNTGVYLRSMEVKLIASADELNSVDNTGGAEIPAVIRQASNFVRSLTGAQTPVNAISATVIEGEAPEITLLFYSIAPPISGFSK